MITPTLANYNVCKVAFNRGAYEDIVVQYFYSDPDKQGLWYYEKRLGLNVLKKMPNTIPAFETDCLLQWLRGKGIIVFVHPYTDPKDITNTLYEVTWKDYHTTWSGYPDYSTALNKGLLEALNQLSNEN